MRPGRLVLAATLLSLGYWAGGYGGLAAATISLLLVLSSRKGRKYAVRLAA